MKKVYQTPATNVVKFLGSNTLMAGSIQDLFISVHGPGAPPSGGMQ